MKLVLLFAIIPIALLSTEIFAQAPSIRWGNAIGGSNMEYCGEIISTSDNRFILAGTSHSNNGELSGVTSYGQNDAILAKIKNNGSLQWIKKYGGTKEEMAMDIVQTSDGNFVFVGITYSNNFDVSGNHGMNDAWLVKVDATTQNIIWQKCIGGSNPDQGLSLAETPDNGFLIGGLSSSTNGDLATAGNHGQSDYWVVKTNSTGNLEWSKCFGGSQQETCNSVCTTSDGGYLIFGQTNSDDGDVIGKVGGIENSDLLVLKLNSTGGIIWTRCIGGTGHEFGSGIIEENDGNIILTAYSTSTENEFEGNHGGVSGYDAFVIKLDMDGNTIWSKPLGGYEDDLIFSKALQNSDPTYLIPCQSGSDDEFVSGAHFGWDFWIVELNLEGDIIWEYCYGGSFQEGPQSCALDNLGRPTIAGYTRSSDGDVTGYKGDNVANDIWVIQLEHTALKQDDFLQAVNISPRVSPNPFMTELHITFDEDSSIQKQIFIYDLQGQLVYCDELINNNSTIGVTKIPVGIYHIKILEGDIQHILKIVKSE